MKFLAPLLVLFSLVCLTSPDGQAVWVAREQVVTVGPNRECTPAAKATLLLSNGSILCVRETVPEAHAKLEENPK
jgi:hypothetical protein